VHAEDAVVNSSRHGQAVEAIAESAPDFYAVAGLALVIKAIDPVDASTLMISTEQVECRTVFDFVREQKTDCLQRLLSSINIVP